MEITSTSAIGTSYSSILSSLKCFLSYVANSDMLIFFFITYHYNCPLSLFLGADANRMSVQGRR